MHTIHNRYALIERVMLTVSSWYKIHWSQMYAANVRRSHPAYKARCVVYHILREISPETAKYCIELTPFLISGIRRQTMPTEYETIKGIVATQTGTQRG